MADEESGFDELMRLSQQFTRQQEEHDQKQRQREAQGKKARGVLQGLRELNLSMAIEQLKSVATLEIIEEIDALRSKPGIEDLRKIISDISENLENNISTMSVSNPDMETTVRSIKTLNILLDLYFSLQ